MQRTYLQAKIHRATVRGTNIDYEGSITIGADLLEAANICPHQRVQVVNCTNGARLETYVIPGEPTVVRLNGATGRLAETGDTVIILSYGICEHDDQPEPTIVRVNENNEITDVDSEHTYEWESYRS